MWWNRRSHRVYAYSLIQHGLWILLMSETLGHIYDGRPSKLEKSFAFKAGTWSLLQVCFVYKNWQFCDSLKSVSDGKTMGNVVWAYVRETYCSGVIFLFWSQWLHFGRNTEMLVKYTLDGWERQREIACGRKRKRVWMRLYKHLTFWINSNAPRSRQSMFCCIWEILK